MNITSIHYDESTGAFVFETTRGEHLFVTYDSYLRLNIHAPAQVSDDVACALREEDQHVRAYLVAKRYALYQPRTAADVRRRLRRESLDEATCEDVVERLKAQHLLDDADYAVRYAQDKEHSAHWSKRRIRAELGRRGVASETIEEALRSLPDAGEDEALRHHVKRQLARRDVGNPNDRQKIIRFLLQKGFDYDAVRRVLSEEGADE
ncbi:MAG: regulatory protein RecX [Peptoniphilaceae bacterium]|nr:regulatory protein RecX [Peptoniphilaceae bacterium]MDY6085989.1 regulatory protein RecX [Peptoniphilaceae bacterium]